MAMEIERKFKLNTPAVLDGLKGSHFLQAYLSKGSVLVRVRVADDKAWLTLKGQPVSTLSRQEWEYEIPVADAREMAKQPGAYALEKTRYLIEQHGHTFEVDRYHGGLEGLYSVEVEMNSEKALVTLPNWVGEELTGNKAWDNESLAREGWPSKLPTFLASSGGSIGMLDHSICPTLFPTQFTDSGTRLARHTPLCALTRPGSAAHWVASRVSVRICPEIF